MRSMLDRFRQAHSNGHSRVVDEPISDEAIERGLRKVRIHANLILLREIVLITAAAAVVWTLFRIADGLDVLAGIRAVK